MNIFGRKVCLVMLLIAALLHTALADVDNALETRDISEPLTSSSGFEGVLYTPHSADHDLAPENGSTSKESTVADSDLLFPQPPVGSPKVRQQFPSFGPDPTPPPSSSSSSSSSRPSPTDARAIKNAPTAVNSPSPISSASADAASPSSRDSSQQKKPQTLTTTATQTTTTSPTSSPSSSTSSPSSSSSSQKIRLLGKSAQAAAKEAGGASSSSSIKLTSSSSGTVNQKATTTKKNNSKNKQEKREEVQTDRSSSRITDASIQDITIPSSFASAPTDGSNGRDRSNGGGDAAGADVGDDVGADTDVNGVGGVDVGGVGSRLPSTPTFSLSSMLPVRDELKDAAYSPSPSSTVKTPIPTLTLSALTSVLASPQESNSASPPSSSSSSPSSPSTSSSSSPSPVINRGRGQEESSFIGIGFTGEGPVGISGVGAGAGAGAEPSTSSSDQSQPGPAGQVVGEKSNIANTNADATNANNINKDNNANASGNPQSVKTPSSSGSLAPPPSFAHRDEEDEGARATRHYWVFMTVIAMLFVATAYIQHKRGSANISALHTRLATSYRNGNFSSTGRSR